MKLHNYRITLNRRGATIVTAATVGLLVLQLIGQGTVYFGSLKQPDGHVITNIAVYELLGVFVLMGILGVLYVIFSIAIGIVHVIFDIEKVD